MKSASLAALLALGAAHEASAYNCTPASANPAISQGWNQRCIPYVISREGSLLGGDDRRRLIANAFDQWEEGTNPCTDLEFVDSGYTDELSGFDPEKPSSQKNVIGVVEDAEQLAVFPSPDLLAITLTSFSTKTGEIFDADILINAVNNRFTVVADDGACNRTNGAFDLSNTLVHEIGHFLGFDHETRADSTMFASAERCEIKKRDLSADDIQGLCAVYGVGEETMTCAPPPQGYGDNAEDFRDQCARLSNTGCDCSSSPSTRGDGAFQLIGWSILAVGAVVLATRKR